MGAFYSVPRSSPRVVVAIGLTAALVACSSDDTVTEAPFDTIAAPDTAPATVDPAETIDTAAPEATATVTTEPGLHQLGVVEVAAITRLPRVEAAWTTVTLDLDPATHDVFFAYLGELGGELVAVGVEHGQREQQLLTTWRSADGAAWRRSTGDLPDGWYLSQVVPIGDGLLAVGGRWEAGSHRMMMLHADPIGAWQPVDLSASGVDPTGVELWTSAAGEGGVVLMGHRTDPYADPSTAFPVEFGAYRVVIDEYTGTYEVYEAASDRLVTAGTLGELHHATEGDGQPIWDLDDQRLITVVPWDVWNAAQQWDLPSLPIPIRHDPPATTIVEWEGITAVFDHANERFEVRATESGELLTAGTTEQFYSGPAPRITDPETGAAIVSVEWDEWYAAIEAARPEYTEAPTVESTLVTLFSADGRSWAETDFGSVVDGHFGWGWALADRWEVTVAEYGDAEPVQTRYVSTDGVTWEADTAPAVEMIDHIESGPAGMIGLQWGYTVGQRMVVSDDARTWTNPFAVTEQTDGRMPTFDAVASGPTSRAMLVTLSGTGGPEPLTITEDGLTIQFHDMGGFEITDDVTGDIVLAAGSYELALAVEGTGPEIVTYESGETTFWRDGTPVLTIPNSAVEAAYAAAEAARLARTSRFALLELDGEWFEVDVPIGGSTWPNRFALGTEALLVATVTYEFASGVAPDQPNVTLVVGRVG